MTSLTLSVLIVTVKVANIPHNCSYVMIRYDLAMTSLTLRTYDKIWYCVKAVELALISDPNQGGGG